MDYSQLDKPALRKIFSARRDALTETDREDMEAMLLHRLLALPAWQSATVICGYASIRGELDTRPIGHAALAAGKTYALPVTLSGTGEGRMVFRAIPSDGFERLVTGRFGIPEPPAEEDFPLLTPEAMRGALLIVPALGFDREGFRIGYGGGYYDRFLDALATADIPIRTVGLCPGVCRVDKLPRETHDRPVHTVLCASP